MTIDYLITKGTNLLEVKQQENDIEISIFEMPVEIEKIKISNLLNELYSKGVMFSIRIHKDIKYIIIYNFLSKGSNAKKKTDLITYLVSSYSLRIPNNMESLFIPKIKKVEQEKNILQLFLEDNSKTYFLAYLLHSVDSVGKSFRKNLTNFIKNLIQAELFEIIVSHIPSSKKNRNASPKWGLMFVAKSNSKDELQKKKQHFLRFLKANSVKLNCKLTSVVKKDFIRHQSNIRLLVPWIKHSGIFSEVIDVPLLLKLRKEKVNELHLEEHAIGTQKKLENNLVSKNQEQTFITRPLPSIKSILKTSDSQLKDVKPLSKESPSLEIQPQKEYNPGNLDDLTIPLPRTMNTVFDAEYLKVRISKIFKEFEFKETVIFEDIFDLVLRRGSYYIFVKFFKNLLNQSQAYKIVETLSSIAGLRNEFLCIVVTDVIEEGSAKILNEFNILHLTLNDVLLDESIKTKIYNTILA